MEIPLTNLHFSSIYNCRIQQVVACLLDETGRNRFERGKSSAHTDTDPSSRNSSLTMFFRGTHTRGGSFLKSRCENWPVSWKSENERRQHTVQQDAESVRSMHKEYSLFFAFQRLKAHTYCRIPTSRPLTASAPQRIFNQHSGSQAVRELISGQTCNLFISLAQDAPFHLLNNAQGYQRIQFNAELAACRWETPHGPVISRRTFICNWYNQLISH